MTYLTFTTGNCTITACVFYVYRKGNGRRRVYRNWGVPNA